MEEMMERTEGMNTEAQVLAEECAMAPEAATVADSEVGGGTNKPLTTDDFRLIEETIRRQIHVKDDMISRLHDELSFYKQGEADRFADQLMKSVIKIRKDMKRRIEEIDAGALDAQTIAKEYRYVFDDLTDLLEQQNIDPFSSAPGAPFDASRHQARIETTNDVTLDKTVKESLSEGYTKGDKTLIAERVVVYKYEENKETVGNDVRNEGADTKEEEA